MDAGAKRLLPVCLIVLSLSACSHADIKEPLTNEEKETIAFALKQARAAIAVLNDRVDACGKTSQNKMLDPVLERELAAGQPIYTAAFILCANSAFGHARKHANHLALLEMMLRDGKLWKGLAAARALEDVYDLLLGYPLIGPFMAYQIAIDLNYSKVIDFSENDFTVAGPGAKRGIRKVFSDNNGMSDSEVIMWMVENQREECEALEIERTTLFGRPLHAIDIQNLFCEVDKYSRVAYPHLKSDRSRIKASFTPSPDPLPLFYPPKWDIRIPDGSSARSSLLVGAT